MPGVFEFHYTVTEADLDALGHANNIAYLQWMQAAALAHSAAQGWSGERYRQLGQGWVVRSHKIEYRQPAVAGDHIVVFTWVATMGKASSVRRYRMLRGGGQLLATAETVWAFIDYATGQPVRIPAEVAHSFEVVDGRP